MLMKYGNDCLYYPEAIPDNMSERIVSVFDFVHVCVRAGGTVVFARRLFPACFDGIERDAVVYCL